jgi:hypothetical protein
MANFKDMAMAVAQKNTLDANSEIEQLKNQSKAISEFFNQKIGALKIQGLEQKAVQDQFKTQDKQNKIKADLLKQLVADGDGPLAIGDDIVGEFAGMQVNADAQGLPVIDASKGLG